MLTTSTRSEQKQLKVVDFGKNKVQLTVHKYSKKFQAQP
jgi:hypothetical protein